MNLKKGDTVQYVGSIEIAEEDLRLCEEYLDRNYNYTISQVDRHLDTKRIKVDGWGNQWWNANAFKLMNKPFVSDEETKAESEKFINRLKSDATKDSSEIINKIIKGVVVRFYKMPLDEQQKVLAVRTLVYGELYKIESYSYFENQSRLTEKRLMFTLEGQEDRYYLASMFEVVPAPTFKPLIISPPEDDDDHWILKEVEIAPIVAGMFIFIGFMLGFVARDIIARW